MIFHIFIYTYFAILFANTKAILRHFDLSKINSRYIFPKNKGNIRGDTHLRKNTSFLSSRRSKEMHRDSGPHWERLNAGFSIVYNVLFEKLLLYRIQIPDWYSGIQASTPFDSLEKLFEKQSATALLIN